MDKKGSKEQQIYQEYTDSVSNLLSDKEARGIFDALKSGKTTYMRVDRVESSSFDLSWIEMIEQTIPSLGDIILNPRLNTKDAQDIVPVELAKKTNADSVKHLASHSQYVKEIQDDGDVIPNKILNIEHEDDYKTYENKFIATLIRYLVLFVEKRYQFIKNYATLHDHETLFFKNKSNVKGSNVEIETKVKVISQKHDTVAVNNSKYIKRIEEIRRVVLYFYNSKFMKMFKTEKNVRTPILQTNIIRKNIKYHQCYELFLFVQSYNQLGVGYNVDEKFTTYDDEDLDKMNYLLFSNYISLQGKDKDGKTKDNHHSYKPEILTSSDDEEFEYGPLLKGPISFVRVDEAYQRYLDKRIDQNLPSDEELKENKEIKDYYSQELDVKKMTKEELLEMSKLIERKGYQEINYDKEVKAIIALRKAEEEEARKKRVDQRLEEENKYLDTFRQKIVDEALKFNPEHIVQSGDTIEKPLEELSALDKELELQKLRLQHEESQTLSSLAKEEEIEEDISSNLIVDEEAESSEVKTTITDEESEETIEVKPKFVNETDNEELKEVAVLPVRPTTNEDVLTAGLDSSPVEAIELPAHVSVTSDDYVYLPMEEEDIHRLTDDERKAILVYDLQSKTYNNIKVPFSLKENEEESENLKKIKAINYLYHIYEKDEGPYFIYEGARMKKLTEELPVVENTSFLKVKHVERDEKDEESTSMVSLLTLHTPKPKEERLYEQAHRKINPKDYEMDEDEAFKIVNSLSKQNPQVRQEKKLVSMPTGYVIHSKNGYYVSDDNYSVNILDAKVYADMDMCNMKAITIHGKVIRL